MKMKRAPSIVWRVAPAGCHLDEDEKMTVNLTGISPTKLPRLCGAWMKRGGLVITPLGFANAIEAL